MSIITQILNLTTRVATEFKALRTLFNGNTADLSSLNTTAKNHIVAAINEVLAIATAAGSSGGAQINDAATNGTETWSSSKIAATVNAVLDGAPGALDTLKELATALGNDASFAATVTAALGNRIRADAAQAFTSPQQAQARSNIGAVSAADVGDPTTDFVATFNTGLL